MGAYDIRWTGGLLGGGGQYIGGWREGQYIIGVVKRRLSEAIVECGVQGVKQAVSSRGGGP